MKISICLVRRFLVFLAFLLAPFSLNAEALDGWNLAGSAPGDFEIGVTDSTNGDSVAYVRSVVIEPSGFGTLMQTISAADYRGTRLSFSGAVKTNDVKEWAGLWMRIDGSARERLGFDNMSERPISDSTDWSRYEIVLDVPKQADAIAFGVLLVGAGEVQIDDLRFDEVSQDIAVTANEEPELPSRPSNLSFEE